MPLRSSRRLAEHLQPSSLPCVISSSQAMWFEKSTYRYDSLDDTKDHVRLLTLLPGEPRARLRIILNTVPFNPQDLLTYEALSYAWGSVETPVVVYVGETGSDTIAVTENLAAALPFLRYRDRSRTLWIDAICVNQMDLDERSRQVQLIGWIYRSASRVIAWIGTDTVDSSYALKALESIGTNVEVDWYAESLKPATSDEENTISEDAIQVRRTSLSEGQHHAIKSLLFRSWFERLWVQQEIRLANDENAILACGQAQLSWNVFRRSILVLYSGINAPQMPRVLAEDPAYMDRIVSVKEVCEPLRLQGLFTRIHFTQQAICSDPRDRVYALLSMHDQGFHPGYGKLNIRPKYHSSVSEVYQQATCEAIKQSFNLNALKGCELRAQNPHNLPSWVPDLSRPRLGAPLSDNHADGMTVPVWSFPSPEILRVRGVSTFILQTAIPFFMSGRTIGDALRTLVYTRPPIDPDSPYVGGGTLLDAYCDALICGDFADSSVPPLSRRRREVFARILRMIWGSKIEWTALEDISIAPDVQALLAGVFTYCDNRTFCTTEQGYIAMAPKYAQSGDQICVFLGCNSPMLLRSVGSHWLVVGVCYVPGLAGGEALVGTLPRGCRMVKDFHPDMRSWRLRVHNTATDEVLADDPRFDSVEYPDIKARKEALHWSLEEEASQQDEVRVHFREEIARSEHPWREENLRKRGVLLRDFDLV